MKGLKAKGVFPAPGDYIHFKSQVPLHQIPVGLKQWRYYEFGPKVVPPLICLPGTAGTADVHYKQVMALSMKGYRVISVDIPCVWNHHEWLHAFEKFLDAIDVHHIHIYGTSLGGFLAQLFAQYRPRRVKSLVLSNTFLDTRSFSAAMPWAPVVSWAPSFLLKRYVFTGIPAGPHEPFIADSVDFVVSQVETLSRDDLASRLTLMVDAASVEPLLLLDKSITIMDTNDYCVIPQQLKDEVGERYPGARRADLKTGGDFPFLSRPDEVNLHLQLHLRRVGVEPQLDLSPGAPRTAKENLAVYERVYEGSSSGQSKSDNSNDVNPLRDEVENIVSLPVSDEPEESIDLPITVDDSCRGPLRVGKRDDEDDAPDKDEGSSRGPLGKKTTSNIKDPTEGVESSGGFSNNGKKNGNDVKDSKEGLSECVPEDHESSRSNEELVSNAMKYITSLVHDDLVLKASHYSEFEQELWVCNVVPVNTCSLFNCRSKIGGCVI